MRRSAVTRSAIAAALVTLAVAGCGVPSDSDARRIAPDELPAALSAPTSTSTTLPPESRQFVQLFYVRADRLVPTIDEIAVNPTLNEVLAALVSGPVEELANAGFRSAFGAADAVRDVTLLGGVATVDLTSAFSLLPPGDQVLGLGQIVLTLTAQPGVGQVRFTLEGQAIDVPRGDGNLATGPVSRDDYSDLLST